MIRIPRWLSGLALVLPAAAAAQDSHYWTDQFGARANLLGGVVIGSKLDLSNTYYNPGAIALTRDPSLLLGTGAFEFTRIGVENAAADGKDVSSLATRTAPSLFAVSFGSSWRPSHEFAFSVLTRRDFDLKLDAGRIASGATGGAPPGAEHFAGEAFVNHKVTDTWVGLSWSHAPGARLGLGVTQYVAVRNQTSRLQALAEAVGGAGEGTAAIAIRDLRYWNVRLLWKVGGLVERGPWTLGLTVTTPSIDLFGSGRLTWAESLLQPANSVLGADFQDGVRAHDRSPLSIGIGGSYRLGRTAVHVSAEWFDRVREFRVLDTSPWLHQTAGDLRDHAVRHRLEDVLNFGVGIEHAFREGRKIYVSFITDRSAAEEKKREDISVSTWDIYHVSAGGELGVSFVDITFGAAFAFGKSEAALADVGEAALQSGTRQFDVTYARLKLLLGLVFPFGS